MKAHLRYLRIGALSLALTALPLLAQDRPRDQNPNAQSGSATTQASPDNGNADTKTRPDTQDRDHANSSATQNDMQDNSMKHNAAQNPDNGSNTADNTQRASSGGGYGLWGLLGLLGLFGLGRRRAVRSDLDTRRDLEPRDRDIRRVA